MKNSKNYGMNQSNISKLEKGNDNITIKTLNKLFNSMEKTLSIKAI